MEVIEWSSGSHRMVQWKSWDGPVEVIGWSSGSHGMVHCYTAEPEPSQRVSVDGVVLSISRRFFLHQ
jgi:hypothetical protein